MLNVKYLIPFIILILSACSTGKLEFQPLDIGVIPVIVNNGEVLIDKSFEKSITLALLIAKLEISKDINITLNYMKPIMFTGKMGMECPFDTPEFGFNSPYKKNIVLFMHISNECTNILGCSYLDSILLADAVPTIITISPDEVTTAMTIIHEFGHIFGARHFNDTHVMTEAAEWTKYIDYSQQSKEEIYKVISTLYEG